MTGYKDGQKDFQDINAHGFDDSTQLANKTNYSQTYGMMMLYRQRMDHLLINTSSKTLVLIEGKIENESNGLSFYRLNYYFFDLTIAYQRVKYLITLFFWQLTVGVFK
jgi:hypothetical protein